MKKGFIEIKKPLTDSQMNKEYQEFVRELKGQVEPYLQNFCAIINREGFNALITDSTDYITIEKLVRFIGKPRSVESVIYEDTFKMKLTYKQENFIKNFNSILDEKQIPWGFIEFKVGDATYNVINRPLPMAMFYRNIGRSIKQLSQELRLLK